MTGVRVGSLKTARDGVRRSSPQNFLTNFACESDKHFLNLIKKFAAHALCSKRRRPGGGGSVYACACVAHNVRSSPGTRVLQASSAVGYVVRALVRTAVDPCGHRLGLATGVEDDRELGDVTVRNFVGGKLNIMHNSDVDPRGVINAGIADMVKKYKAHQGPRD